jgi:hypothetical protein
MLIASSGDTFLGRETEILKATNEYGHAILAQRLGGSSEASDLFKTFI